VVLCGDGMKFEDYDEFCDPLSPECELEPQLDGPDKCTRFTQLNNLFILHNTSNNNAPQEVYSTLGVSVSVSRIGGRKQKVV
jgi:hypothetical protein